MISLVLEKRICATAGALGHNTILGVEKKALASID